MRSRVLSCTWLVRASHSRCEGRVLLVWSPVFFLTGISGENCHRPLADILSSGCRENIFLLGGVVLEQQSQEKAFWEKLNEEENKLLQKKGKIAWICSYTPVEIITACGLSPYRFPGKEGTSFLADAYLHSSLCFFARCSLERVLRISEEDKDDLAGMVLVNSCSAMMHFYHVLEKQLDSLPFKYLLDIPRDSSEQAQQYYAENLRDFHQALSRYCGCRSSENDLWEQIQVFRENRSRLQALYPGRDGKVPVNGGEIIRLVEAFTVLPPKKFGELFKIYSGNILGKKKDYLSGPRLFIMGSIIPEGLAEFIRELGGILVLDDLCIGRRTLQYSGDIPGNPEAGDDPYSCLARLYLERDPCPRMRGSYEKLQELERMLKSYQIDGVILYYSKFCDPWYYYGQLLKEKLENTPLLVLEGEHTGITGQMRTRISAFLEMLG